VVFPRKLVGGAVVLVALAIGAADVPANPPVDVPARLEDPLRGTWDTGHVSMDRVRRVMMTNGYTMVEVNEFWRRFGLQRAASWQFNFRFYRKRGVPYVTKSGWNPDRGGQPLNGDSGPYHLLPKQRFSITDQKSSTHRYREVYAYRLGRRALTLRVISETDPTLTKKELRLDMLFMYAASAAPLKRVV
jgi:hypothetical protein